MKIIKNMLGKCKSGIVTKTVNKVKSKKVANTAKDIVNNIK